MSSRIDSSVDVSLLSNSRKSRMK